MALTVSKRSRFLLVVFVIIGLAGLVILLLRMRVRSRLYRNLVRAGVSSGTARMWVAVSAFETDGWTSINFTRDHNPVGMTLASANTTAAGLAPDPNPEALARYDSLGAGIKDLVLYMFTRFKYPGTFTSIGDLANYMQSKGYFTGDPTVYSQGVQTWYNKLYSNGNT
jgi:hypothetical protein